MKKNGILDKVAIAVDLPGEAIPGQPLIEIVGERRILVENHRGVVQYGEKEICLRVNYGYIKIVGCGLHLVRMTKQQLIICGNIDKIELCRGGKR